MTKWGGRKKMESCRGRMVVVSLVATFSVLLTKRSRIKHSRVSCIVITISWRCQRRHLPGQQTGKQSNKSTWLRQRRGTKVQWQKQNPFRWWLWHWYPLNTWMIEFLASLPDFACRRDQTSLNKTHQITVRNRTLNARFTYSKTNKWGTFF